MPPATASGKSRSCKAEDTDIPPTVVSAGPGVQSPTSVRGGGNVSNEGGSPVTDRGYVYSSSNSTPTIGGVGVTRNSDGSGTGFFSSIITVTPGTTYYVRAYANGQGAVIVQQDVMLTDGVNDVWLERAIRTFGHMADIFAQWSAETGGRTRPSGKREGARGGPLCFTRRPPPARPGSLVGGARGPADRQTT